MDNDESSPAAHLRFGVRIQRSDSRILHRCGRGLYPSPTRANFPNSPLITRVNESFTTAQLDPDHYSGKEGPVMRVGAPGP